jgi:uncharacterized protein YegP (UPF0339 family)
MAKFVIYQDRAGEYRWRLRANNGKTTADSGEGYGSRACARQAADRVRLEVGGADIEDE